MLHALAVVTEIPGGRLAMLIRATPHACFVILSNGLTLELFYDEALAGLPNKGPARTLSDDARSTPTPSQGVWLMGDAVLFEVSAGQA